MEKNINSKFWTNIILELSSNNWVLTQVKMQNLKHACKWLRLPILPIDFFSFQTLTFSLRRNYLVLEILKNQNLWIKHLKTLVSPKWELSECTAHHKIILLKIHPKTYSSSHKNHSQINRKLNKMSNYLCTSTFLKSISNILRVSDGFTTY